MSQGPLPIPTAESTTYWQAALEGQLKIQYCPACARHQFYPRRFCTQCLSERIEWVRASGRGRIYTYTVCHVAGHPAFESRVPYAIGMVELDEGVRMLAGIVASPDDRLAIGAPVEVCFERISNEIALPMFRLTGRYTGDTMIIDSFDAGATAFPDRVFVQGGDVQLSYRAAADASHAVAAALARDVQPGTHVGVLSPNHPMVLPAMLGVMRSGAVFVPLNARDAIEDIVWFASFCEIAVLVCHAQYAPHLERLKAGIPTLQRIIGLTEPLEPDGDDIAQWVKRFAGQRVSVRRDADDIALIKSSGGTTGRPKAIMQSHRSLETAYRITNQFTPPRKAPVHLVVAPLTHAAGATMVALARFGARNVIAPSADPGVILEAIERERVTHIFLPPTLIYRLLAHPEVATRDCSSLEYVLYGAAPMSVDKLREGLARWGQVFMQSYGQSEVPGVITCLSRKDHFVHGDPELDKHLASAGRPSGACEVALMDDEGRLVPTGERGEIVARGDLVSPGYYNNPEATAEARAFGWHHTGDIGVFDENGYLYVVDRKKDMVISGGFNIYPSEIEQVIWGHPAVQDCAVVGVPDADWGERLTAVIELKPGGSATAEEITELCSKRFGSLKTPKQVEFWPTLPRSPVGKVLKKDVRAQLTAAAARA